MKRFVLALLIVISLSSLTSSALAQSEKERCDILNQKGNLLYHQAQYDGALVQFQQANECYRAIDDRTGESRSLNSIGDIHYRWGETEQALEYYQQSLTIAQEIDDQTGEGNTLNNIGDIYYLWDKYEQALDYYQQSLTIYQEINDRAGEGNSLNNIGDVHYRWGQYDQALKDYQNSLSIAQEIGNQIMEGNNLNDIGDIYYHWDEYEQASDYYRQSLTIHEDIGNQVGEGGNLNNIGDIYKRQGKYEQALDYYQRSLNIAQEIHDRILEGNTLKDIGQIYSKQGEYEQAMDYYRQSLTIRQEIGDQAGEGTTLTNIGYIHFSLGQYEQAMDYYQQSLTIHREVGNRRGESAVLSNMGCVYSSQGQYEQALEHYWQSLSIDQKLGDRVGQSCNFINMGNIYYRLGQYEQALEYYQQNLTIYRELGDRGGEGQSLSGIGLVYERQGQYEQALDNLNQSLAIDQEIGNRHDEGHALHNIGLVYANLEKYEQALKYYQKSLIIRREIGDRAGQGATLDNIGNAYFNLEKYDQALDYHEQSLTIRREIGNQAGEGVALTNIGSVYDRLGQYNQGLDYYQQAIETVEAVRGQAGAEQCRASYIEKHACLYRRSVALLHQQDEGELAFYTTERGRARAFLDSLTTGQVRLWDDDAAELLAQEQEIYDQRQSIRSKLVEAGADVELVADLEIQLAELNEAYEAIKQKIIARKDQLAQLIPGRSTDYVLGVKQLQPLLDEQSTLISYYVVEDNVLAFVVTRDNFETILLEVSPKELETQTIIFRDFADLDTSHPNNAITLHNWLIDPLKEHLNTSQLIIIPHSVLHYLPFAALTDGEQYLIDDYMLTVLPSASTLPFIRKNMQQTAFSDQPSILILGNPSIGSPVTTQVQLGSLPFAEKEAQTIAELFGIKPLIDEAATETVVRQQVSEANILHLAAHGQFNPVAPLNSLIALAPDETNDGWLTVGESYGLNLENTDLVVLSACETNLGDLSAGDELVGLTRALIFAGTPSVIASLWAVEDETTSLLMERFYTHLRDGVGKAEALRQAQIEVRTEYPNPYYWSGFVLSGDPGFGQGSEGTEEQGEVVSSSGSSDMTETTEGQSSGNCLSLLVIIGALGSVGVVVRRRNG
ncbi:MAG: tetratricopeptide repeat protein [Gammaproteobacteria bacterium]|nr:tetratricopeptide repeat protein [Gammaproteobacteria bacterium]